MEHAHLFLLGCGLAIHDDGMELDGGRLKADVLLHSTSAHCDVTKRYFFQTACRSIRFLEAKISKKCFMFFIRVWQQTVFRSYQEHLINVLRHTLLCKLLVFACHWFSCFPWRHCACCRVLKIQFDGVKCCSLDMHLLKTTSCGQVSWQITARPFVLS